MASRRTTRSQRDPSQEIDWDRVDPDITYAGKQITLPDTPEKMPLRVAASMLDAKADDEETLVEVTEEIDAFPADGAHAFNKALTEMFGWSKGKTIRTFFGDILPEFRAIQVGPGPNDTVQVPWGHFTLPNTEGTYTTGGVKKPNKGYIFVLHAEVPKKNRHILTELANRTREILAEESIYRGKAIRLTLTEKGGLNMNQPPEFLKTDHVKPDELILNQIELAQINSALWTPILHTKRCKEQKIPLKRGVLLEGKFGTGKTMTATVTSKICVDNGWTFILLDDVRHLKDALIFARRYQPAVVFAEDIDRLIAERDDAGNDLLNTIDGVIAKDAEVITVLTTNHVELLDKAMLRPGRLDAVVQINAPEADSVEHLIRLYGRDLIAPEEDLTEAGEALAGQIPATIREAVERSKLSMISLGENTLTSQAIAITAESMKRHLELLNGLKPDLTEDEEIGIGVQKLTRGLDKKIKATDAKVDEIKDFLVKRFG